jgi:hypothetical protein
VLRARERAPTPSPSAIFNFGLIAKSIKELEGASCDVNVILIEEFTSFALSSITTDRSCLVPIINVVKEVDNSRESDSVEEDEGSISKPETHTT